MSTPKVSVIVPIHNAERYLRKCLDSILVQTFPDFELLLINDGSEDSSGPICEEYASKDQRIHVFHKTNGGVSSARNVGLDNARGQYVTFVDADDWVMPDMLACVKDSIDGGSTLISIKQLHGKHRSSRMQYRRNESFPSMEEYLHKYRMPNAAWGIIFERNHIEKQKLRFNEELVMSEDCVFTLQYFASYQGRVHCAKDAMYAYNNGNQNSACNTSSNYEKCVSQITSATIMTHIPAKGKMMRRCIQTKAKRRCHYFLHALVELVPSQPKTHDGHTFENNSKLWNLYKEAYDRLEHHDLRLWLARHLPRTYILCHTYLARIL